MGEGLERPGEAWRVLERELDMFVGLYEWPLAVLAALYASRILKDPYPVALAWAWSLAEPGFVGRSLLGRGAWRSLASWAGLYLGVECGGAWLCGQVLTWVWSVAEPGLMRLRVQG